MPVVRFTDTANQKGSPMKIRLPDLVTVYGGEDSFRFHGAFGEWGDVSCRLSPEEGALSVALTASVTPLRYLSL